MPRIMPTAQTDTEPKTTVLPRSVMYDYWTLTRMHKFPLGSILVFWPCGESLAYSCLFSFELIVDFSHTVVLRYSLGYFDGRKSCSPHCS